MKIIISIICILELCFAAPLHAASEPRAPQTTPHAKNRKQRTAFNLNHSAYFNLDLARICIAHGAHDFYDTQIRDAASLPYPITLLLLIRKEKRELQPSDDMLPCLKTIFSNDLHALKFLKWWKEQDPVRLAIETKINYIYSLCAQPKSPKKWSATERSTLYERNKRLPVRSLSDAIYNSDVATLRRLIAEGADVNQFEDCPPITLAIREQRQSFMDNECDCPNLCPPVRLVERRQRRETIIRELLAHGADVNNTKGTWGEEACNALLQAQFGPGSLPYPKNAPYTCIELTRDLIAHGAHDRDDIVIREAQNDVALLLLIHKEKRELQPSDDMLPWLTKIFGNDRHALKFLKWWKRQDRVRLAIETKINYIYSLCAQPKSPEELTATELSNFYERNKN